VLFSWTIFLPETPRWLIKNGFPMEGLVTLADLHGTGDISDPAIQASYAEIAATIESENALGEASWDQVFKQYTRQAIMGITCQLFAQFNGINAILYFLPENLGRAGFTIPQALLYSGACALIYCAGTIPTMFLIDKWGRKIFLLAGSCALAIALAIIGGLQFHADALPFGDARIHTADGIFAAVCVYLFFFGAT
jgi:MFS family permease